ncbi:MAG: S1C family serine protease, partial [Myxococcota bacterium]
HAPGAGGSFSERLWTELPPARVDPDAPIRASTFRNLARRANPAVVSIFSTQATMGRASIDPFGILPFALPIPLIGTSLGSGFIIRADGFVLTADHVVASSRRIKIVLMADETGKAREYQAKILGRSKEAGIALLKFAPEGNLPVLPLGDSERVEIGDQVLAVGNPYGLSHTVTSGIVSFIGRELSQRRAGEKKLRFIQIDAPINPGNSGGPLLNLAGEVIGINTAVAAGAEGIGFAVPVNSAKQALPRFVRTR